MPLPHLIEQAIEAHGGRQRWARVHHIDATISAGGFLFSAKRCPVLVKQRMRAWPREPRFAFLDMPATGDTSELIGDDEVRVTGADGAVKAQRRQPRQAFTKLDRLWRWGALDFVYFGGYATWNYLVTPFVFLRDGFRFEPLSDLPGEDGPWQGLRAHFPPGLPTHSPVQDFYFDRPGRLRRLDYTAQVVGRWAHSAHVCEDFRLFDGLLMATRRTVKPLLIGRRPLAGPVLVALHLHDVQVHNDDAHAP